MANVPSTSQECRKRNAETSTQNSDLFENTFISSDFQRAWPSTDDLCIYQEDDKISLALVTKSFETGRTSEWEYSYDKRLHGETYKLETVPDGRYAYKIFEKLLVIDRPFCVGDHVQKFQNAHLGKDKQTERWAADTMLGVIIGRKRMADVCNYAAVRKAYIKDVSLDWIPPLTEMNLVAFGQWVGRVQVHVYNVIVNYKDRHRAQVRAAAHEPFGMDLMRASNHQWGCPVFPGEAVTVSHMTRFFKWITPPPKFKRRRRHRDARIPENIICKVESCELAEVHVDWFYSPSEADPPKSMFKGEELKSLTDIVSNIDYHNVALETIKMSLTGTEVILSEAEYFNELTEEFNNKFVKYGEVYTTNYGKEKKTRVETQDEGEEEMEIGSNQTTSSEESSNHDSEEVYTRPLTRNRRCNLEKGEFFAKIVRTKTVLTVKWSDGTIEYGIPSHALFGKHPDIDQENHLIDNIILKKTFPGPPEKFFGIIKSVDEKERSCVVQWYSRKKFHDTFHEEDREECTLFDIMPHPKFIRVELGTYGIDTTRDEANLKDILYQFVQNLDNGKQKVRFLDGRTKELFPDEGFVVHLEQDDQHYEESVTDEEDRPPAEEESEEKPSCMKYEDITEEFVKDRLVVGFMLDLRKTMPSLSIDDAKFASILQGFLSEVCNVGQMWSFPDADCFVVFKKRINAVFEELRATHNLDFISFVTKQTTSLQYEITPAQYIAVFVDPENTSREKILRNDSIASAVEIDSIFPGNKNKLLLMNVIDTELNESLVRMDRLEEILDSTKNVFVFTMKELLFAFKLYRLMLGENVITENALFPVMSGPEDELPSNIDDLPFAFKHMGQKLNVPRSFGLVSEESKLSEPDYIGAIIEQMMFASEGDFLVVDPCVPSGLAAANFAAIQIPYQKLFNIDIGSLSHKLEGSIFHPCLNIREVLYKYLYGHSGRCRCELMNFCQELILNDRTEYWHKLNLLLGSKFMQYAIQEQRVIEQQVPPCVRSLDIEKYGDPCPDKSEHECARTELLRWKVYVADNIEPAQGGEHEDPESSFSILPESSVSHKYYKSPVETIGRNVLKAIRREYELFKELPPGIFVRAYSDRSDLLCALIVGPDDTPYEGVPFLFHIYLPPTYPHVPPQFHYVAYSKEQLNPNLYQNGKVCVSLLGTWEGKGSENWIANQSSLLQVLISIQSMILVVEPFYNEAGYADRKDCPDTIALSKRYCETAAVNSFEYMYQIYTEPPSVFQELVKKTVEEKWFSGYEEKMRSWVEKRNIPNYPTPGPSKGFHMALQSWYEKLSATLEDKRAGFQQRQAMEEDMVPRPTAAAAASSAAVRKRPSDFLILFPGMESCFGEHE